MSGIRLVCGWIAIACLLCAIEPSLWSADPVPQYPLAIAVGKDDTIYLADRTLPGLWKVDDTKATLLFQASKKFRTPLNAVRCVAIDKEGVLLAGDSATRDIYRIVEGQDPKPLTNGGIGIPAAIAVDAAGDIFVADLELHRIFKVPAAGGEAKEFAAVAAPRGLAFAPDGTLWVVSHGSDQVVRLSADGMKKDAVVKGQPFQFPHHITFDDEGTAYIADGYAKAVWRVKSDAAPEKLVSGAPLDNPVGIAWNGKHLLVVDPRANALFLVTKSGELTARKLVSP